MTTIFVWLIAYFLGSIPFGVVLAKLNKIDIRQQGSGNIGATNVNRVLGKKAGVLTLMGDCAKGALAVFIASLAFEDTVKIAIAGFFAFCGHLFSVFLKFQGGKGVATGLGVFLYLMPWATLSSMGVFAVSVKTSKYVSLGSILAAATLPLFGLLYKMPLPFVVASALVAILTVVKHHENIQRLLAGTENKLGKK